MRSFLAIAFALAACHNNADDYGVGAECTDNTMCDSKTHQVCLLQFKGGYCGIEGCTADADCPPLSKCVVHTDGHNYCFRTCIDKTECNKNRSVDFESNCSANVTFTMPDSSIKACVPPS
jgi:hypothetical protein